VSANATTWIGIAAGVALGCGGGGASAIPDGPTDDVVTTYNVTTSKGAITIETHRAASIGSPSSSRRISTAVRASSA